MCVHGHNNFFINFSELLWTDNHILLPSKTHPVNPKGGLKKPPIFEILLQQARPHSPTPRLTLPLALRQHLRCLLLSKPSASQSLFSNTRISRRRVRGAGKPTQVYLISHRSARFPRKTKQNQTLPLSNNVTVQACQKDK